jgi:hypothetical protein
MKYSTKKLRTGDAGCIGLASADPAWLQDQQNRQEERQEQDNRRRNPPWIRNGQLPDVADISLSKRPGEVLA